MKAKETGVTGQGKEVKKPQVSKKSKLVCEPLEKRITKGVRRIGDGSG